MSEKILIRKGLKKDCKELVHLMEELVKYEGYAKWGDDIESFCEDGFGENPWFHTFVVEVKDETGNEKLVGFCLFYYTYVMRNGRRSYLECLYVVPEWRKHGLGKKLCKAQIQDALNLNCKSVGIDAHYTNTRACNLYKSMGAVDTTKEFDYHLFVIEKKEMEDFTLSE